MKDECLENINIIKNKVMEIDEKRNLEIEAIIKAKYKNINGIVTMHKGKIVFERYYNGYDVNDVFHVASVTKSIISALIGIAIDKGFIKSVNEKVVDFFPEYAVSPSDVKKRAITIKNLLTMTAPYPFKNWNEPLDRFSRQPDLVKYAINQLGTGGKIGEFKYSTSGAHLLSAILTKATGKSAREFANEHLFKEIGMKEIPDYKIEKYGVKTLFGKEVKGWVKDPNGISAGGWGITLNTRDMARFGQLYLNNGEWNGRQIISRSWIEDSTAINSNRYVYKSCKYGYLWWLREEDEVFSYSAEGAGGNIICCIPEKDLVIAIASEITFKPFDRGELIKKFII